MSWWMIYLWTRLDTVIGFSILAFIISTFASFCAMMFATYGSEEERILAKRFYKIPLSIFIVSILSLLLVPSKDDMALIYVVPKMSQSETFKHIAESTPEITKLGLEVLQKELKELVDEKKGETK
jgi:hypothetical protein